METGRVTELHCLTPGETGWVERALDALGGRGDAMARDALAKAVGRKLMCEGGSSAREACPLPATHYAVNSDGTTRCYCAHQPPLGALLRGARRGRGDHWGSEIDPADQLGLKPGTDDETGQWSGVRTSELRKLARVMAEDEGTHAEAEEAKRRPERLEEIAAAAARVVLSARPPAAPGTNEHREAARSGQA